MQRVRHLLTRRRVDPIVDDEITEWFRALVSRHLAECIDCTEAVAMRRAMKDALTTYRHDPEAIARLAQFVRDRRHVG